MTQVPTATVAVDLGSDHPMIAVDRGGDGTLERLKKTGPAGAALELPVRDEQPIGAAGARERPGPMLLQQRTRPGSLGRMLAQDGILFRREGTPPLGLGLGHRKLFCLHRLR